MQSFALTGSEANLYDERDRPDSPLSISASRKAPAVPLVVDGVYSPFCEQGGKMQNSQDFQRDLAAVSLDAIGGEPLAESGFETEEPESGFSATEMDREE